MCDGLFFHWKPVFFPDNIFVFHTHGVPVATTYILDSRFCLKNGLLHPSVVCSSVFIMTKFQLFSLECKPLLTPLNGATLTNGRVSHNPSDFLFFFVFFLSRRQTDESHTHPLRTYIPPPPPPPRLVSFAASAAFIIGGKRAPPHSYSSSSSSSSSSFLVHSPLSCMFTVLPNHARFSSFSDVIFLSQAHFCGARLGP